MKHFIVELIYKVPIERVNEVVGEHREFLQKGYNEGIFLLSGPQVPKIGGIIIARAESMEALSGYLKNDPYNIKNVADYEFIEFNPVKSQEFLSEWLEGN